MSLSIFALDLKQKWMIPTSTKEENFTKILNLLKRSNEGQLLVNSAQDKILNYGKTIFDVLEYGDGSVTDTTLLRRFSPHNPFIVSYDSNSKIYLNKNLNIYHAVLDLAHELNHFVYREEFNPLFFSSFKLRIR